MSGQNISNFFQGLWRVLYISSIPYVIYVLISQTLLRFLNWIPLGYIFETQLISTLVYKVTESLKYQFIFTNFKIVWFISLNLN